MKKELTALREVMTKHGVDVYVVPTGDFHGSEYIHDYFKTREYISGFTGSAGTLIVAQDEARLWTDSRYFLQAAMELKGSGIELMKDKEPGVPSIQDYLKDKLVDSESKAKDKFGGSEGKVKGCLAFDGRVMSYQLGEVYSKIASDAGWAFRSNLDLVGMIWSDRPALEGNPIWNYPLSSAGLPFETKIEQVRELMAASGADYNLITTLDDNAWLYNLRGSDVARTPVFFSYTLITPDTVNLYIETDPDCEIPQGVTLKPYFADKSGQELMIDKDLADLTAGASILLDPKAASFSTVAAIPKDAEIIQADYNPSTRLKACKNEVEIKATTEAHINDGVAMVNFLYWLKHFDFENNTMTEIGVSDYLEEQRSKLPGYIDLSFDTIAGYGPHGAIVHYSATPESDATLKPEGFLLVDSGGQYMTGTTDITRTIALGPLTDRMKECYTTILKGHVDLAMAKFPDGTTGKDLDLIAKAPIEKMGLSYNHGTGHGVGHTLCVHEDPNRINTICEEPIIPGMITSDEPGYYPEGEFGIRIEGELLCVADVDNNGTAGSNGKTVADSDAAVGPEFRFEMLTCCPYEREAIIKDMLTKEEIAYIDDYHTWVRDSLQSRLEPEVYDWLDQVCRPL